MIKENEFLGKKYNKLTIKNKTDLRDTQGLIIYDCQCECGNLIKISASLVVRGKTKSCGCLKADKLKITIANNVSHGKSRTSIYYTWAGMLKRCYLKTHKQYPNYGARGIKVCDEWLKSFVSFYRDMGDKPSKLHSLDRIDNNGDYEPKNCRWATPREQSNNTRNSIKVFYRGKSMTLGQWSDYLNIPRPTVYWRYKQGWDIERVLA